MPWAKSFCPKPAEFRWIGAGDRTNRQCIHRNFLPVLPGISIDRDRSEQTSSKFFVCFRFPRMRENGDMSLLKVVVLAIIQGLAELLPVSSSAHVVVAERLMGLDVSSPAMTLLLVMLHTGTMFAVIVYFWKQWKAAYFSSAEAFRHIALRLLAATTLTGIVGYGVMKLIEKTILGNLPHAQIEDLFGHLEWIAPALAAAGVLIIVAGVRGPKDLRPESQIEGGQQLSLPQAVWVGAVQGLSLPFRGFSRSGATISTGMLAGVTKVRAETFSFALAVI